MMKCRVFIPLLLVKAAISTSLLKPLPKFHPDELLYAFAAGQLPEEPARLFHADADGEERAAGMFKRRDLRERIVDFRRGRNSKS
jgi:hypothetical protein